MQNRTKHFSSDVYLKVICSSYTDISSVIVYVDINIDTNWLDNRFPYVQIRIMVLYRCPIEKDEICEGKKIFKNICNIKMKILRYETR